MSAANKTGGISLGKAATAASRYLITPGMDIIGYDDVSVARLVTAA
ncbi:MAG: hypothetical protein ACR2PA_12430 [Hyphomicrobiaceae bacterium]